tara:strand:+ start:716 stop:1267 length:552 start_codon:yes stop_codon:yes gene_type:complete
MKTILDFVDELKNLSEEKRICFPMHTDCYSTLIGMQKDCYGVTTLEDLNLHKYKPSAFFGEKGDGISPFVEIPLQGELVLEEWNSWWNQKILDMGYTSPTDFLLDNGLERVSGDPVVGDISWNQHFFGNDILWLDEFRTDRATQVIIYDGENWLYRKKRRWGLQKLRGNDTPLVNGIFRISQP